ncbi:unnamed protein product [Prunus armeniaca]|uniref:Uncharacterized protein n=1 Tax=Prunus armeniaca TaxID=36596 RepID=A0A6J5UPW3_PRUAR|nr:unnamed protein product [Prunus armeniaca]
MFGRWAMVGSSSLMNLVRSPPNLAPDLPFGKGRKLVSGFRAGPWCFSSSGLGAGLHEGLLRGLPFGRALALSAWNFRKGFCCASPLMLF